MNVSSLHATNDALNSDVEILNRSIEGERFGVAAYDAAIGSGLLDPGVIPVAEQFRGHHIAHANYLIEAVQAAGGTPAVARTWEEMAAEYPPPPLNSQEDVLRYAASLEASAASGDIVAIAELALPEHRALVARIAGVEAMHWAVLRGAVGEDPVPDALIPLVE